MAVEGDDKISIETRLTKGVKIPAAAEDANKFNLSTLAGEIRDSKVKVYATDATNELAT